MKENERWSGHVVFLTITAALAAGLVAAFAAIFADPEKLPGLTAKILIILSALFAVATLSMAILASARLSNYLVLWDYMPVAARRAAGGRVTMAAGAAFIFLFVSSLFLLAFFVWVALFGHAVPTKQPIMPPFSAEMARQLLDAAKSAENSAKSAADAAAHSRHAAEAAVAGQVEAGRKYDKQIDDLATRVNKLENPPPRQSCSDLACWLWTLWSRFTNAL